METTTVTPTIGQLQDETKRKLADRLLAIKHHWPYAEKMQWCITNAYNTDYIAKKYLRGFVHSIPVAQKLIEAIETYMKANNIVE